MSSQHLKVRLVAWSSIVALAVSSISCMTTYDTTGRPVQSVDPGLALAGVAAAGLIGYAASNNNRRDYRRGHSHHYRPRYHDGYGHGYRRGYHY